MLRSAKFWILMMVFQVVFGLTVFALTRQHYIHVPGEVSAAPGAFRQATPEWPADSTETDLTRLISSFPGQSVSEDPVALASRADELFANGQYARAAVLYEQLLATGSNKASTYNNLGITLHYLGRSTEALGILDEGVDVDPTYQRIWLTLGFINSQLGNAGQARSALETAVQMGADTQVGQSAQNMLNTLESE